MTDRLRVLVNLIVFGVVFLGMIYWASQNVVSFDRVEQPYELVVEADAASGVSTNAEVAYLGVHYGRVASVDLLDGGVRFNLLIDRGREIPEGSTPRIFRKSAIGEPYIDFQPPDGLSPDNTEFYAEGSVVPIRALVPLEFSELLRTASDLISTIEPETAASLLDELALALDGRGEDLRRFTIATDRLVSTFAERTDTLDRLADNNTRLTAVLADHRGALGSTISDLALLSESLRSATGDTQVLLDRGTALLAITADLVEDARPSIDCLLDDLVPVMDATSTPARLADLEHLLQTGPQAFAQFAGTLDVEPDGPWVRVNLQVDLSSPPRQYIPPLDLPGIQPMVACPGVVGAGTATPVPGGNFRPSDVLGTGGGLGSLPATGVAVATTLGAMLLAGAYSLYRISRAGDDQR